MRSLRQRLGRDLEGMLAGDIRTAGLGTPEPSATIVGADEIADLPPVVRRYLDFMGVVRLPRVHSFRGRFVGRFRMRPGRRWMPCEAMQFSSAAPIGRVFRMRVDVAGIVPMVGLDRYAGGAGHMSGKLLGLITVADGSGPALDLGELTTYLNDAILLAPSMLLVPSTIWTAVDDRSFDVSVTDRGLTSTARVTVGQFGAPVSFTSEDRYAALPGGLVRARWTTPVDRWTRVAGRALPVNGRATWTLPDGDFTYVEGAIDPTTIDWNPADPTVEGPGRAVSHPRRDALGGAARIAANLVAAPALHRRTSAWGADPAEARAVMPGDGWMTDPRLTSTRAVTIDAPPAVVWSWLVQIGHGRGGLYSYDGLENLIGCDLHSAERIDPALQHLAVGDLVALGPPGYPCYRVAELEDARSLVLVGADPKTQQTAGRPVHPGETGATWQWLLNPVDEGRATRLVVRQRTSYPPRQAPLWHVVDPISFVMERRMLLGIKERAELVRAG